MSTRRRFAQFAKTHRILMLLVPMIIVLSVMAPNFLTQRNLTNVLLQLSIDGILALGMTIVIIGGGFDLSIGSVVAAAGVVAMAVMAAGGGVLLACVAAIVVGLVAGAINAFLTTKLELTPFIASLATMVTVRGVVMGVTDARPISHYDAAFNELGNGTLAGVPVPALILLVVAIVGHLFLTRMRAGRHVFALGGNEEAARLAGVPTGRIKAMTYLICSSLAGLSGVLLASRLATGSPIIGESAPLAAVSAVLLGGTSLVGGAGSIVQTLEGLVFLGLLSNGMNLLKVPAYFQALTQGLFLIGVVVLDTYSNRSHPRLAGKGVLGGGWRQWLFNTK